MTLSLSTDIKEQMITIRNLLLLIIVNNNFYPKKDSFSIYKKNIINKIAYALQSMKIHKRYYHITIQVFHLGFECDILLKSDFGDYINVQYHPSSYQTLKEKKFSYYRDYIFDHAGIPVIHLYDDVQVVSDEHIRTIILEALLSEKKLIKKKK